MNVTFTKDGSSISMQATDDMMFAQLAYKYCTKVGIDSTKLQFFLNSTQLKATSQRSLSELNIYNGAVIRVVGIGNVNEVKFINVCFSVMGRNVIVQGQTNQKFSELVTKFCTKAGVSSKDNPSFILNSQHVGQDESRTLGELNLRDNSRIDVVLLSNVIGAF